MIKKISFISRLAGLNPEEFKQSLVVVIDVLRATTSMVSALRFGCSGIVPCASLAEARRKAREYVRAGKPVFLAGERGGLAIPGFDAGNSPLEFKRAKGKTVFLTTTNGTRALTAATKSRQTIIACLNNLSAVGQYLVKQKAQRIVILASGEAGREALEDTYAAGRLIQDIIEKLGSQRTNICCQLDANALQAFVLALQNMDAKAFLLQTPHGQALKKLGFKADIDYAAKVNITRLFGTLTSTGVVTL